MADTTPTGPEERPGRDAPASPPTPDATGKGLDKKAGDAAQPTSEKAVETVVETKVEGTGFYWGTLAFIVLLAGLLILGFQNTQTVTFRYLVWEVRAPLFVIVLGTAIVAVLLDEIVGAWIRWRRRRIKQMREELKRLKRQGGTGRRH